MALTKSEYQKVRGLEIRLCRATDKRIKAEQKTGEFSLQTIAGFALQRTAMQAVKDFSMSLLAEGRIDDWQAHHRTRIWKMCGRMVEISKEA